MRTTILLGVFLCLLGCGSRTGIKRAGVDASIDKVDSTGTPTNDAGGPATEVGGPSATPDTAAITPPDAGTDRPLDQALPSGDTGSDRPLDQTLPSGDAGSDRLIDQALPSDGRPDGLDGRADVRAEPGQTPSGNFELLDDSPWTASPDAGQCVPGFIRTYAFEFPTGAQTVKVIPASSIMNFPMDGTLSDTSGTALRYDLNNPLGQLAGELYVWPQGSTWFVQLTVYGSRPDSGCVHGELMFRGPI